MENIFWFVHHSFVNGSDDCCRNLFKQRNGKKFHAVAHRKLLCYYIRRIVFKPDGIIVGIETESTAINRAHDGWMVFVYFTGSKIQWSACIHVGWIWAQVQFLSRKFLSGTHYSIYYFSDRKMAEQNLQRAWRLILIVHYLKQFSSYYITTLIPFIKYLFCWCRHSKINSNITISKNHFSQTIN